jgi:predicted protein tyrosine phosphatase
MKIEVKPVFEIKPEKNSCVVAITGKEIGFDVPFIHLIFGDVGRFQHSFINEEHVETLRVFLPVIKKSEKTYIGCDRGRNRSPALALAVAEKLGYKKDAEHIREVYKFMNYDVYDFLKERL